MNKNCIKLGPIGIFDSGYGGLTILSKIKDLLPQYDYIYLGDNSRAPYGNRSDELVLKFTEQAVKWLFAQGCNLIILACNTASAKALRNIQQNYLPLVDSFKRVLGVIRPTVESVVHITKTGHIAVLGTENTIHSNSYLREINKLNPNLILTSEACPMWVPLVENDEHNNPGADYFVEKHIESVLQQDNKIDTIILGCTHYPLLLNKIEQFTPDNILILPQDKLVAKSLQEYLNRHQELENSCSKNSTVRYYTTESPERFRRMASLFLNESLEVERTTLETL